MTDAEITRAIIACSQVGMISSAEVDRMLRSMRTELARVKADLARVTYLRAEAMDFICKIRDSAEQPTIMAMCDRFVSEHAL